MRVRPARFLRRSRRVRRPRWTPPRAVAALLLATLGLLLTTQQAVAEGVVLQPVSLSGLTSVSSWFQGSHWGTTPQQKSGTAAGHRHHVSPAPRPPTAVPGGSRARHPANWRPITRTSRPCTAARAVAYRPVTTHHWDTAWDASGATVTAASLHLFDTWASTCTAERFDVALVKGAWTPSSVTTYPGPSHGSSIGHATPSVPNACANTAADRTVGDWVEVPLSTSAIQGWFDGSSADHGLAVYAATSDALHWKQFG
jgi:hypothetical protein